MNSLPSLHHRRQPRFRNLLFGFALSTLAATANAQVEVEQRVTAPTAGEVSISSDFGTIVIHGWENKEVLVTGTLAVGYDDFDLDRSEDSVDVSVDTPESWLYTSGDDTDFRSQLEVWVPQASSVWVETVNARISMEGVRGAVEVESVGGPIQVTGPITLAEVETLAGTVEILEAGGSVSVEAVNGDVTVDGATGDVEVVTVSGSIDVGGQNFREIDIETTSGNVTVRGSVERTGSIQVETFSGSVGLQLPSSTKARFDLMSYSGKITSSTGPRQLPAKRNEPYSKLSFATGPDDFEVEVETFKGDINLELAPPR